MTGKSKTDSKNVMNLSARLAAVQAVYQSMLNEQSLSSVLDEYRIYGHNRDADEPPLPQADMALFGKILSGIQDRREDLNALVAANMSNKNKEPENLLKAVLLCAGCEIVINQEVDTPIIINDYLNVTHSFFGPGEAGLVNAVLDSMARAVRA